jgi:16S rRNA (adenine1518-N6/adenine1519-N6)-dimethyltransferase
LISPKGVREILEQLGHRPNKQLGQNYLIDGNILRILTDAAELKPDDSVLEIGPGLGVLTRQLIAKCRQVTSIEKDPTMAWFLRSELDQAHFSLIEKDALDVDYNPLFESGIQKVAANLPYSVGSRVLIDLTEARPLVERIVVMLQLEVGDRICAGPGNKHYGLMAILTGMYFEAKIAKKVSPNCFMPPPKVWSAVVLLRRREKPLVELTDYNFFKQLVKTCFSQRRKMVGSLLRKQYEQAETILLSLDIDPSARPETISIEKWGLLANALQASLA